MDIKSMRKAKQLTQAELARTVDVSRSEISNIENGKNIPRISLAKRLAAFFNVDWTMFYEEERG